MSRELCFNEVELAPVDHQGSIWIKAVDLSRALGYGRENQVSRLYRNNADEFTPDMTQVIEIVESPELGFPVKARIFSLRGCHLIAMFARTPVAKSFRRWVLDVLEKYGDRVQPQPEQPTALPSAPLTPSTVEQRRPLDKLIKVWAQQTHVHYAQLWTQVNSHFNLSGVSELPTAWIPDAIAWVQSKIDSLPVGETKELPALPTNLEEECLAFIRDVEEAQQTTRAAFVTLNHRFAILTFRLGSYLQDAAGIGGRDALPTALYHLGTESLASALSSLTEQLPSSFNPGYYLLSVARQLKGVQS